MIGALAASGWIVAADRLSARDAFEPDATEPDARRRRPRASVSPDMKISIEPASLPIPQPGQPHLAPIEKPLIARLQESDVVRTLSGILTIGGIPDATRMGWPTLRAGFPLTTFLNAMREMRAIVSRRSPANAMPVMMAIGAGDGADRSIVALNIALAAARDGARVLMIDADHATHALSNRVNGAGKSEPSRLGWLSIGSKASRAIKTANGISILPVDGSDAKTGDTIRKAIAQARSAGGYDLAIVDGPAMPWSAEDRKLLDSADGLVAILPVNLDINDAMEEIIAALGGTERKLIGVVISEINPVAANRKRDKQYA
jgi:Mrp family chromosome partitioning ATPase